MQKMKPVNKTAPYIDNLIHSCQRYPQIKNSSEINKLLSVFSEMCKLEEQGYDEIQEQAYDFQEELTDWVLHLTKETIAKIQNNVEEYNRYIEANLPYEKRTGRILRKDFWTLFPDFSEEFETSITPSILQSLKEIKTQSELEIINYLPAITSGDFFRYCEMRYNANGYFNKSKKELSALEKYINMADGRDCGLKELDETSYDEFQEWYTTKMNCGGHPWEICRGGNSTHISLFVCRNENGYYLRLEGSSRVRVIETIKIAAALLENNIPFILGKAEEIYRMACGIDYIGIVPETVTPKYCHSSFPDSDNIIDFMNLGTEKKDELINKAFWYPLPDIKLA